MSENNFLSKQFRKFVSNYIILKRKHAIYLVNDAAVL